MADTTATLAPELTRLIPAEMVAGCLPDGAKYLDNKRDIELLDELVYTDDPKYTNEEMEILYKIEELRQMIYGSMDLETRTDDEFLMRFLRTKHYDVEAAYKQIVNYESFLERHNEWRSVHMDTVTTALGGGTVNVLPKRDAEGRRLLWFRTTNWQTRSLSADQILQVGALCAELGILESTTQRSGLVFIYDMKDFGLSHLRCISPTFARRMTFFLAECLPLRIERIHVVNEPSAFSILFSVYKRFLSERIKERIHFHGQDLASLHEFINPEFLPEELGGVITHDPKKWLALTDSSKVIKELEFLNYRIVDGESSSRSSGSSS